MEKEDIFDIYADGKKVGEFLWKHKKTHKNLFNLSGVEVKNRKTGDIISRGKLSKEDHV